MPPVSTIREIVNLLDQSWVEKIDPRELYQAHAYQLDVTFTQAGIPADITGAAFSIVIQNANGGSVKTFAGTITDAEKGKGSVSLPAAHMDFSGSDYRALIVFNNSVCARFDLVVKPFGTPAPAPGIVIDWSDYSGYAETAAHGPYRAGDNITFTSNADGSQNINVPSAPPTGGAGGVLSGEYPNPGFAVNMATQQELDNAIATRQLADDDLTAYANAPDAEARRGLIGALGAGDNVSELANDAGYVDNSGAAAAAPVQSVDNRTGAVTLDDLYLGKTATAADVDPSGPTIAQVLAGKADKVLNNPNGSGVPGVNDDETEGYSFGSIWVDKSGSPSEIYKCVDATEGAAEWVNTSLTLEDLGSMALEDAGDYLGINDASVTNSREWTADTVSQAEAEAGTATTRRAWTAQRVRQAIAAWWGTVSANIATLNGAQTFTGQKTFTQPILAQQWLETESGVYPKVNNTGEVGEPGFEWLSGFIRSFNSNLIRAITTSGLSLRDSANTEHALITSNGIALSQLTPSLPLALDANKRAVTLPAADFRTLIEALGVGEQAADVDPTGTAIAGALAGKVGKTGAQTMQGQLIISEVDRRLRLRGTQSAGLLAFENADGTVKFGQWIITPNGDVTFDCNAAQGGRILFRTAPDGTGADVAVTIQGSGLLRALKGLELTDQTASLPLALDANKRAVTLPAADFRTLIKSRAQFNLLGTWDPVANTPALTDGTGNDGDIYFILGINGNTYSVDTGDGNKTYSARRFVRYEAGKWIPENNPNYVWTDNFAVTTYPLATGENITASSTPAQWPGRVHTLATSAGIADGWPVDNALIVTTKLNNQRIAQEVYEWGVATPRKYMRGWNTGAGAWSDWQRILRDADIGTDVQAQNATLQALADAADDAERRAVIKAAPLTPKVNAQTGTTYTLALVDAGAVVTATNADAVTVTVPTNAAIAYPVGTVINVLQGGAGAVTVEGDTGVTVNGVSGGSVTTTPQYQGVSLLKVGADEWIVSGAADIPIASTTVFGLAKLPGINALTLDGNKSITPAVNGEIHNVTLEGNHTLELNDPADTTKAVRVVVRTIQDATGGRTLTWGGTIASPGGVTPPAPTTDAAAVDQYEWLWTGARYELVGAIFDVEAL